MKRSIAVAAAACLVLPAAAGASHSNGQGPKHDFVQGTGTLTVDTVARAQFHANAKSGPSGEDPRGHVHGTIELNGVTTLDFRGRVTCLNVNGNRGVVGAEIERGEGESGPLAGTGILLEFEDNGSGNSAPPDASNGLLTLVPPPVCPPAVIGLMPFAQGNFVVHDAVAP